jgi:hypothetical protein
MLTSGQTFDDSVAACTNLVNSFQHMHYFLQEYTQFSTSIEKLLKHRHKTHQVFLFDAGI